MRKSEFYNLEIHVYDEKTEVLASVCVDSEFAEYVIGELVEFVIALIQSFLCLA